MLKLYEVEASKQQNKLLVIATDAGAAEAGALDVWGAWNYSFRPFKVTLIAENRKFPHACNIPLVFCRAGLGDAEHFSGESA